MPRTYLIHFHNVGRQKKSWSVSTAYPSANNLIFLINQANVLMSNDVDVEFLTSSNGLIYAGYRKVGSFTIPSRERDLN